LKIADHFQVLSVLIAPRKVKKDIFEGLDADAFKEPGPGRADPF
jgi:hypothetical protein